jgi:hypothetical protein
MKKLLIIPFLILGSGCSQQIPRERIVYITTPLPLPARPVLPVIESQELQCLSSGTRSALGKRDVMRRQYAEELETIIKSTRK